MLVKDIMNPDVQTISGDATIQEAAQAMSEFGIGCLIVTKDTSVTGIITERDIMRNVVSQDRGASQTKVKDAMSDEVVMVDPDMTVDEAADLMMERKIKKLPVIKNNQLVGIVTVTDICMASPKIIEQLGEMLLVPKKGNKPVAG
jgi:CBS domain-containing protein